MTFLRALLISTLAGISTLIGYLIIYFKIQKKDINSFISFCLGISISVMIGISILDLIPASFLFFNTHYSTLASFLYIIIFLLIGILIVNIINRLLKNDHSLFNIGILSMISLIIHNFPEGIATFMSSLHNTSLGIKLAIAIVFHNIPEGISIAVPIYYATNSKKKAFYYTLLSSLAEPAGAIITYAFFHKYFNNYILHLILLLVAGIMISLAINHILPKSISYKCEYKLMYGILLGILIVILNHFIFN